MPMERNALKDRLNIQHIVCLMNSAMVKNTVGECAASAPRLLLYGG